MGTQGKRQSATVTSVPLSSIMAASRPTDQETSASASTVFQSREK